MKQPYNTALYYRLSRDDENFGDSVSIENKERFYSSLPVTINSMWWMSILMTDGQVRTLTDRHFSE